MIFSANSNKWRSKRTALFRAVTQRVVVIPCRPFGTTFQSHRQGSRIFLDSGSLTVVPKSRPETSVRNCHHTLRTSPEERSSHLLHGRSLKSRKWYISLHYSCIIPKFLFVMFLSFVRCFIGDWYGVVKCTLHFIFEL